jgi:SAM-dependent methyltransferase
MRRDAAVSAPAYDRMGVNYSDVRHADRRLEEAIWAALGDVQKVLNVGAGTGSYEPRDRQVIAVEPSPVMIAQRPSEAAPVIQGIAEQLPLADNSVDATMGVFTLHHWDELDRGLAEVLRVTRRRVVFVTLDLDVTEQMWLCRDYLPEIIEHHRGNFPAIEHLRTVLPGLRVATLPVPNDWTDGFCVALWSRPEAHLDSRARRASSIWHRLAPSVADNGLDRLRHDLDSGEWDRRYGHLRTQAAFDIGVRLVTAEVG